MMEFLGGTWPWYVAGPLIGLVVPALLLLDSRVFGVSSNLRTLCAMTFPRRGEYLKFDWRRVGGWNLAFAAGIVLGGVISATLLGGTEEVGISAATVADLQALGITDFSGLVPGELFSWDGLLSVPGMIAIVVGGFLVGFGTAYGGGCTSGHAIMGLADFQLPSLIAVIGFFVGGLIVTHLLLPVIL